MGQARKKEKKNKRKEKEAVSVITPQHALCLMLPPSFFPSARLDVAREQFQDHSDIGRADLEGGGGKY